MSALARLRADLVASGLATPDVDAIAADYACALRSRTTAAWEAFYNALFAAMNALAARPPAGGRAEHARRSLTLILTDDLGTELFAPAALERLVYSVVDEEAADAAFSGPRPSGAARSCR
jgi:hypothetical protein